MTFQHNFSVSPWIDALTISAMQSCYALKTLKNFGMNQACLQNIYKSLVISKITYASQSWRGFSTATDLQKLNSVIHKATKWGYLENSFPTIEDLLDKRDSKLFSQLLNDPNHTLHFLLPPEKPLNYNLRQRAHNRVLPPKENSLLTRNFLYRMLYKNSY